MENTRSMDRSGPSTMLARQAGTWYNQLSLGDCRSIGMRNASKSKSSAWLALGSATLGILLTISGLWMLSWHSRAQPASAVATSAIMREPTTSKVAVLATLTAPPLATPTQTPPTVTPPPLPTITATATNAADTAITTPVATATQTPNLPASSQVAHKLELAIVHSNDTWGYTLPCG